MTCNGYEGETLVYLGQLGKRVWLKYRDCGMEVSMSYDDWKTTEPYDPYADEYRCRQCGQPLEECDCGSDEESDEEEEAREDYRRLTRHERLQAAADAGFDTWDDYNGDK